MNHKKTAHLSRLKKMYFQLWSQVPLYRANSPGELLVNHFFYSFGPQIRRGDRIIDFGCGTGRVARYFFEKELDVTLVDFCSNCLDLDVETLCFFYPQKIQFVEAALWELPKRFLKAEWIYCCDVLEHVPENKIEKVLETMASSNLKGGFLSITLKNDMFGEKVFQEPLHLCVKSKRWWIEKLLKYWKIVKDLEMGEDHLVCCISKK